MPFFLKALLSLAALAVIAAGAADVKRPRAVKESAK